MAAPATYWAITVACAAPAAPQPNTATNSKSRAMFNAVETPKKTSGARELPIALR